MHIPPGFTTVFPYVFATNARAYLEFLAHGLGGELLNVHASPDGAVRNAHVRFGDTTIMVSEARGSVAPSSATHYLYVEDADAAMARAIAAGGRSLGTVADMPYGDRQGGVEDPSGNIWWLSQRLTPGPYSDREAGSRPIEGVSQANPSRRVYGEVSFLELGSTEADVGKSQLFFARVFGWRFHPMPQGGGWFQTPSIRVGLHGSDPGSRVYIFFGVPDLEEAIATVRKSGGEVESPGKEQPGFGRFSICRDPQGIPFGLHQSSYIPANG